MIVTLTTIPTDDVVELPAPKRLRFLSRRKAGSVAHPKANGGASTTLLMSNYGRSKSESLQTGRVDASQQDVLEDSV